MTCLRLLAQSAGWPTAPVIVAEKPDPPALSPLERHRLRHALEERRRLARRAMAAGRPVGRVGKPPLPPGCRAEEIRRGLKREARELAKALKGWCPVLATNDPIDTRSPGTG